MISACPLMKSSITSLASTKGLLPGHRSWFAVVDLFLQGHGGCFPTQNNSVSSFSNISSSFFHLFFLVTKIKQMTKATRRRTAYHIFMIIRHKTSTRATPKRPNIDSIASSGDAPTPPIPASTVPVPLILVPFQTLP